MLGWLSDRCPEMIRPHPRWPGWDSAVGWLVGFRWFRLLQGKARSWWHPAEKQAGASEELALDWKQQSGQLRGEARLFNPQSRASMWPTKGRELWAPGVGGSRSGFSLLGGNVRICSALKHRVSSVDGAPEEDTRCSLASEPRGLELLPYIGRDDEEPPESLEACVRLTPPCFPPIHHPFLKPEASHCDASSCPGPCLILLRPTRARKPSIYPGPATWTFDPELQPAGVRLGNTKTSRLALSPSSSCGPAPSSGSPGHLGRPAGRRGRPPTGRICLQPRLLKVIRSSWASPPTPWARPYLFWVFKRWRNDLVWCLIWDCIQVLHFGLFFWNPLLWDALIIWGFKIKELNDALVDLLYNYTKRPWNLTASITLSCVTLRKITRHPGCVHFVIVKRKEEKRCSVVVL